MKETPEQRAARLRAEALGGPTIGEDEFVKRSRRAFLTTGLTMLAGTIGWQVLTRIPDGDRIPRLLRDGHQFNEKLWRGVYSPDRLAPTFATSASAMPKANGRIGIRAAVDLDAWQMRVMDPDGATLDTVDMDDIRSLPKVEMTTEMKCIEGWSQVITWGGARFSDFAARYAPRLPAGVPYVGMATPDGAYTVGLDMPSTMHPQTLLAYEMQGEPLSSNHGAPLRLVTPLKYGVKHIKRIGTIRFMNSRPEDYWAERGYDWFIGH